MTKEDEQAGASGVDAEEARTRILDAARGEVLESGWASATSGRVAARAGVSKALVHYHFRDKHLLLAAVAETAGNHIGRRAANATPVETYENPVDAFSDWLMWELDVRDFQLLMRLQEAPVARIRNSTRKALDLMERTMRDRVRGVLDALGLESRLPTSLVVGMFLTLACGMAVNLETPGAGAQQLVETLWLSVLSMAE